METLKPDVYRDKNGKYLNKNDIVTHNGVKYKFHEVLPPIMLARVTDYDGNEHFLIPSELEREEYV